MKTRRVRVHFFNPWARALEDISVYLDNIPNLDLSEWVERPDDGDLLQRARLDCDWHGECARCFSSLVSGSFRIKFNQKRFGSFSSNSNF